MSISIPDQIYHHGFHVIDNFLSAECYQQLCALIRTLYEDGHFRHASIGHKSDKMHNTAVRNDQTCWLDKGKHSAIDEYFYKLDEICVLLNRSLFLGLDHYEAHFAVYQPNGFYKKHVDQFATTKDRRISCVYYLNEHWQPDFGGELTLYNTQDELLTHIQPLGNRFVCFNSDMPHEVCTAYQTRYSIAAWLKVRSLSRIPAAKTAGSRG